MGFTSSKLCLILALFFVGSEGLQESSDLVRDLPGQPNVSFSHFAGYITVNESHGRALFYWLFEAVSDPSSKPLVLWLNGGPGCSSVGYGQAEELGPFRVDKDGASLLLNDQAWNNEVNLLFLESPAGVGFSYSNTTSDYSNFGDTQTALDAYAFLVGLFKRYPKYLSQDFYIAGESYAGHYVPQLAKLITDMNNSAESLLPPLKGILIGNAALDNSLDAKGIVDFAWSHAIVSDGFYKNISNACFTAVNQTLECTSLLLSLFDKYRSINIYNIYTDVCYSSSFPADQEFSLSDKVGTAKESPQETLTLMMSNRRVRGYDPCITNFTIAYLNRPDVQRALHANKTNIPYAWTPCSTVIKGWVDAPNSMLSTLKALISAGLRVWVFSGDTDGRVPFLSSRYSVGALELPTERDWYPWFYEGQVGGWSEVYQGLTYATVRGAGHMVPSFQPGRALALLTNFIAGTPLPNSSMS